MDDDSNADASLVRLWGGVATPTALGFVAKENVPSGSGNGTTSNTLLPPKPTSLNAPGQNGGHNSAAPRGSATYPAPSSPLIPFTSISDATKDEVEDAIGPVVVLTIRVTYPQSEEVDAVDKQVALVGGVTSASHIPFSDTSPTTHLPEPSVADVPARNAACNARKTTVVEPVRVIEKVNSASVDSEMLSHMACAALSTADRLRVASATFPQPDRSNSSCVALTETPSRADRMIPKSVTRIASTHKGHSVAETITGCVPTAIRWPSVDADELTRHLNVPTPLRVPKYAPTVSDTLSATESSDDGSHVTGPADTGAKDMSSWKSEVLCILELCDASGPAGDTEHERLTESTPPLSSEGQRLSLSTTGLAASESEMARTSEPTCADECNRGEDVYENSSAYGSRDVLGVRVCVAVCERLLVKVGVTEAEVTATSLDDCVIPKVDTLGDWVFGRLGACDGNGVLPCDSDSDGDMNALVARDCDCVCVSVTICIRVALNE